MSKIEKFVSFAWTAAMLGLTGIVATGIPPYPAFAGTTDSSESSKARELVPYPHDDIENQIFYFVMPDRFADGNPCNNQGDPEDPISSGGFDPTDKGMYHGGDIKGLTDKLDYIEGLGVTAIWLTPILKNKAVQGDSAGYHGYWTLDFTQLDPHLGSNEEMKTFIEAAHARGIKVFFDIIANHTADVIKYKECHQPDGSHQEGLDSCEYKSLSQLAAGDRYTPFIPEGEEYAKVPAWLNDPKYYHNQGDSTFSGENSLNGDFFGLDDLYTEKPEVVAGMIDIYKNLISDWKPDGFRMDTVKHVNPEFWQAFAPAVIKHAREEAGIKDFTLFGEVYSAAPAELSFYTTTGKIPSVLDFGFQAAAAGVVSSNADVSVLEELFASDDRYNDADSSANQLLTFLGNHDMGRLGHILKEGEAGSDAELSARCRLANALMFFSRGVPVIYYGDEQGFTGDGGDKDAREDMFASRVDSYNDNDLIGTEASTADDNFDSSHPLYQSIAWLSAVYKAHPVLRHGIQMARPNSDESGKVLTFSRVDLETGTEYLLAFNFSSIEKKVTLPAAASSYESVRGGEPEVSANNLDLTIPAMDFVIVKATGIAPSPAATPTLSGIEDGATVTGMLEVTVNAPELNGLALPQYQVRFEASRNGGDYETLAVDNNAPYRLFWDTTALKDGTEVTLRAAMSNLVEAKSTEVKFTVDSRSPEVNLVYENASALPAALIYNNEGGVMLVTDSDPANKEFTTRLDWGMTPSRLLVFADLGDKHKNARVEKPIVLDRNKVMQMTREDNDGNLVATLYLNSDGQLSTSDNHSGTSRELLSLKDGGNAPLPADVNVRGGFNGWGTSPLEYAGQGTYRGSVSARQGLTEYKFGDASWGKINLGAPMTGQGLTSGTNPGNLMQVFDNDGNYNFTLLVASDSDARRYLLHAVALNFGPFGESLFLQGNFSEGQSGRPFTFDGKSYRLEVPLTPGTYKLKPANGTGTRTLPASELKLEKGGEGLSLEWDGKHIALTVETEANYVFELNHDGQVFHLQVTRASLPGEDLPPFGDTPIYVKGEIAGDTLMSYQGNGIYEALVVLDPKNTAWGDDGVSAFKVGDANWSNVNLGATDDGAIKAGVAAPLKQGSNTNLTYAAPEGVYKVSVDASDSEAPALTLISVGKNYAVVHYSRKGGDYSGWGLHAWGDIVQGFAPEWKAPIALSGKDDFGRFAAVPMTASTKLGFILHKGDDKNTPADLFFTPSPEQREIWILQGDATIYDSEAAAMAAASE